MVRKMDIFSSLTIGKGLLSHWRVTVQVGLKTRGNWLSKEEDPETRTARLFWVQRCAN